MSINYVNCWCMHLNRFLSFRMKIAKGSTMTIRSQKICFAPVTGAAESIHALATLVDRCCAGKKTSLNMYIFVLLTKHYMYINLQRYHSAEPAMDNFRHHQLRWWLRQTQQIRNLRKASKLRELDPIGDGVRWLLQQFLDQHQWPKHALIMHAFVYGLDYMRLPNIVFCSAYIYIYGINENIH